MDEGNSTEATLQPNTGIHYYITGMIVILSLVTLGFIKELKC